MFRVHGCFACASFPTGGTQKSFALASSEALKVDSSALRASFAGAMSQFRRAREPCPGEEWLFWSQGAAITIGFGDAMPTFSVAFVEGLVDEACPLLPESFFGCE